MKHYIYTLFIIFLFSCGSKKITKPDWAKSRPVDPSYYIGIGMNSKNKSQISNQYIETAKKNALNDMASEISVKISSSSVLNTMDLGNSFNEEFVSNIKTSTNLDLEGYEQIGTYEDENEYWVYYRLNKATYQFRQKQKQDVAISKATDFYKKAQLSKTDNDYRNALNYYVNSLESLKEYFGESLETTINGKKVYLANEIISEMIELVKDMKIETKNNKLSIKRGIILGKEDLIFYIKSIKTGNVIKNIPLEFFYTEKPISNNRGVLYDNDGAIKYNLGKVTSKKYIEIFSAKINIIDLVKSITTDHFITKISEKINSPKLDVTFNIKQSNIYIKISEKNIEEFVKSEILNIVTNDLDKEQIKIVKNSKESDYLLNIEIYTKEKETLISGNLFSSVLLGRIEVFNEKKELVFKYNIDNIESKGNSYKEAGLKCYSELEKEFRYKLSKQIYREVFEK